MLRHTNPTCMDLYCADIQHEFPLLFLNYEHISINILAIWFSSFVNHEDLTVNYIFSYPILHCSNSLQITCLVYGLTFIFLSFFLLRQVFMFATCVRFVLWHLMFYFKIFSFIFHLRILFHLLFICVLCHTST